MTTGLVQSLAHPGGHVTGVSEVAAELSAKRLQLLQEAVPSVHTVAVLWNADDRSMTLRYRAAEVEAQKLGLAVVPLGVRAPDDFETAFSAMNKSTPDAILMVTDVLTLLNRQRVIAFARRTPPALDLRVHGAGPMTAGCWPTGRTKPISPIGRSTSRFRILRGASPAELPLELPTRFELALNLKTAAALGLTIPDSIQLRADDVIE
ncbi:MAG: ABC transporter substrate-binding protein [Pseudomonadota bacterium]